MYLHVYTSFNQKVTPEQENILTIIIVIYKVSGSNTGRNEKSKQNNIFEQYECKSFMR